MIDFNLKDELLNTIQRLGKFSLLATKYNYRIYGLRNEENPPILIEFWPQFIENKNFNQLRNFFKTNEINAEIAPLTERPRNNRNHVYIGLRLDLRQVDIKVCVALLNTIIYNLEQQLTLRKNQKINKELPELLKIKQEENAKIKEEIKIEIQEQVYKDLLKEEQSPQIKKAFIPGVLAE